MGNIDIWMGFLVFNAKDDVDCTPDITDNTVRKEVDTPKQDCKEN